MARLSLFELSALSDASGTQAEGSRQEHTVKALHLSVSNSISWKYMCVLSLQQLPPWRETGSLSSPANSEQSAGEMALSLPGG